MKGLFFCLMIAPVAVLAQPNSNINPNPDLNFRSRVYVLSQHGENNASPQLMQNLVPLHVVSLQQRNINPSVSREVSRGTNGRSAQQANTMQRSSVAVQQVQVSPNVQPENYSSEQNVQVQSEGFNAGSSLNEISENNVNPLDIDAPFLPEPLQNDVENINVQILNTEEEVKEVDEEKRKVEIAVQEIELTVIRFNPKAKEGKELMGLSKKTTVMKRVKRKKASFYSQNISPIRFLNARKNKDAAKKNGEMIPCFRF